MTTAASPHVMGATSTTGSAWPACRLDRDLQPVEGSNVDVSATIVDPPGARPWHADARLSVHGARTWVSYHDNHDLFAASFEPGDPVRPRRLVLTGRKRRERERNWGLFGRGDVPAAVYTIAPHVVLELLPREREITARPAFETPYDVPWDSARWGEPHGGSPPVRIGDRWFAFFQSNTVVDASGRKVYAIGFYGFDAAPPYEVRYMTAKPLLTGDDLPPPYSFYGDYRVAYPSGAVLLDRTWLVSLGIHDNRLGVVTYDHERLLEDCVRVG